MILVAALVIGIVAIVLVGYIVREATVLKTTAAGLQAELQQFKEGGFDRLIGEKLSTLTQSAAAALEERERLIQQSRAELLEHQRRTVDATERFKMDEGG